MLIGVGADAFGVGLKDSVVEHLHAQGHETADLSGDPPLDYPDIALTIALDIAAGRYPRALLFCATGLGMAIVANKVGGIRAVTVHDAYSAERSRKSNDAQILTMGAELIDPAAAIAVVSRWMATDFAGGRSAAKLRRLKEIDRDLRSPGPADPSSAIGAGATHGQRQRSQG